MRVPTMWYLRPAKPWSLCLSLEYSMSVKLLTEHHLRLSTLKVGCTGSSESTLVKMPHCWESHVAAQINFGLVASTNVSANVEATSYQRRLD